MSAETSPALCSRYISDGDSRSPTLRPCKRTAAGQLASGEPACRFHLLVEARAAKRYAVWETEYAADKARGVAVQALIDQLATFGIKATAHFHKSFTEKVVVDPVALLALLRRAP